MRKKRKDFRYLFFLFFIHSGFWTGKHHLTFTHPHTCHQCLFITYQYMKRDLIFLLLLLFFLYTIMLSIFLFHLTLLNNTGVRFQFCYVYTFILSLPPTGSDFFSLTLSLSHLCLVYYLIRIQENESIDP